MQSWQFWALASAAFAAVAAITSKIGVEGVPNTLATMIRTAVILPLTVLAVIVAGHWQPLSALPGRAVKSLILSGLAAGGSWLCYYRALQMGPVTRVAPFEKISIALVVILGVLVLGEPLTWKVVTGTALIISGALLLAW